VSRWLLLALGLCASCDRFGAGEAASVDAGLAESPRALACARWASANCARVAACAPFLSTTTLGSPPSCTRSLTVHCLASMGLGGSARTPSVIASCADAIEAAPCDAFLGAFPEACAPPPGELPVGAPCAFDEQCRTTFCAREPDTACGACAPAPVAGQACTLGACARGLACNGAGTCVKPGSLGDACGANEPCARLTFCSDGRCVVRRRTGEGCAGFGQCDAFGASTCAANSICIDTKLARQGEPCSLTANELVLCEAPYRCIDDRCQPAKPEGAACGAAGAHECAGYRAECLRGRCVVRVTEACAGFAGPAQK
jgi:hypothetical protein